MAVGKQGHSVEPTEPDETPVDAGTRLRLRLQAAERVVSAMETTDLAERERLLAEARALLARADRGAFF